MSSVVTYRNDRTRCFCQLRFDSGERVLISLAARPSPSVRVVRLVLGGLLPRETVWECAPGPGGNDAYVEKLLRMFPAEAGKATHPLDVIRDFLLACRSISEARELLAQREQVAESAAPQASNAASRFSEALLIAGNRLRLDANLPPCDDAEEAAVSFLTHLVAGVLGDAGPDHTPHPEGSSPQNAAMGACFLAVCLAGLCALATEDGVTLNPSRVYARVGSAVFSFYSPADQARISSGGTTIFESLKSEAETQEGLREWVTGVHALAEAYARTGNASALAGLTKLYLNFASAREA